jgi:hypothetical protein
METVCGIHQGFIYEGGGVNKNLFKDKEAAIAEATRIFEMEIARQEEYRKLEEEGEDFEVMLKRYEDFKWRKCDKRENRWHNTVDEIQVVDSIIQ